MLIKRKNVLQILENINSGNTRSLHAHCPYYFILSNYSTAILFQFLFCDIFLICDIYYCYYMLKYDPQLLSLFIWGNIILFMMMEIKKKQNRAR